MTDDQLRSWAESHAAAGCPQAAAVLRLLGERDAAREMSRVLVEDAVPMTRLAAALAERVHAQSELLIRRAERFDDAKLREAVEGFVRRVTGDPDGRIDWGTGGAWLDDFAGHVERWRDDSARLEKAQELTRSWQVQVNNQWVPMDALLTALEQSEPSKTPCP